MGTLQLRVGDTTHWLIKERTFIGRAPACEIPVTSPKASRHHALLWRAWDGVYIVDNQSKNGTFVNGHRIEQRCRLRRGDCLTVGGAEIYVIDSDLDLDATPAPILGSLLPETSDEELTETVSSGSLLEMAESLLDSQATPEQKDTALAVLVALAEKSRLNVREAKRVQDLLSRASEVWPEASEACGFGSRMTLTDSDL